MIAYAIKVDKFYYKSQNLWVTDLPNALLLKKPEIAHTIMLKLPKKTKFQVARNQSLFTKNAKIVPVVLLENLISENK